MHNWPSFFNKERGDLHTHEKEGNNLEKEAEVGNEDGEERALWGLCAVGSWKLLHVARV